MRIRLGFILVLPTIFEAHLSCFKTTRPVPLGQVHSATPTECNSRIVVSSQAMGSGGKPLAFWLRCRNEQRPGAAGHDRASAGMLGCPYSSGSVDPGHSSRYSEAA